MKRLGRHIRLGVVRAKERDYLATVEPLARTAEVSFHLLPEEPARLADVAVASVLPRHLLRVRQDVVHHRNHDVATVKRDRVRRPVIQVLGLDPDKRLRERH